MVSADETSSGVQWCWTQTAAANHSYLLPVIRNVLARGDGSLLDIGCGSGVLTEECRRLGWKATGVDPSSSGIELARSAYPEARFEVASATDDLSVLTPPGGFDVVMSCEVIEHLYSPSSLLRQAHDLTRAGGLLIVTTPYHGYLKNLCLSFANRWDRHFDVHRDGWHIKFFSKRTLIEMVERNGYTCVTWLGVGRRWWMWRGQVVVARRVS